MPFSPDAVLPGLSQATLDAAVTACSFSFDGAMVFWALEDGTVCRFALATGDTRTRRLHEGRTASLIPTAHGCITGGEDGRVMLWQANGTVLELAAFSGQTIAHLGTSLDSTVVAAALETRPALLSLAGQPARLLSETRAPITALAVSRDGRAVAAGHAEGVTVYAPPRPETSGHEMDGEGGVSTMRFSPDGGSLACATDDRRVRVYDLDRSAGALLEGYPANVRSLSFAHDGSTLWTGGEQAFVGWPLGPVQEGEHRHAAVFGAFDGLLGAVAAHPAMPLVAGGFDGGTIMLGSPSRLGAATLVSMQGRHVTGLTWSPDGRFLAGGTDSGDAFCLDLTAKPA